VWSVDDDMPSVVSEGPEWDALVPLMAHGLLAPMSVIRGFAEMLKRLDNLDDEKRAIYLARIIENADYVTQTLTDMARGLPPEAWSLLEDLDAESMKRYLPAEPT